MEFDEWRGKELRGSAGTKSDPSHAAGEAGVGVPGAGPIRGHGRDAAQRSRDLLLCCR